MRKASIACLLLLVSGLTCNFLVAAQDDEADDSPLAEFYGFSDLEIFKLARRSANMVKGDFNADGLVDILIVDNSHSRLDLLQQRTEGKPDKPARVNDITSDWRFKHVKIPVDKGIVSMAAGDLDGDKRTDIIYLGAPDKLIVRYQGEPGKSDWSRRFTVRLPNVQSASWMMAVGDLNHDQRDDLVVLGKAVTYVLYQDKEGKLKSPVSITNTSSELGLVSVADLDGDGRQDLCYLASDGNSRGLCARLQTPQGQLGAELRFDLNRPRAVTLANLNEDAATEILTIDSRTGRVAVSRIRHPEAKAGQLAARLTQYGFGEQGSGKDRDLDVGDIDGDGLLDVVVTDPDHAQMLVFRQERGRGLAQPQTFPGLLGANQVRVVDLDGDKRAEVVVLSNKEKVLAVSRFANGRLTFPQAVRVPAGTEPLCFDVSDMNGDRKPDIVLAVLRNKKETYISALTGGGDEWTPVEIGGLKETRLEFPSRPSKLRALDANNDGRSDLIAFFDLNRPPTLVVAGEDGKLAVTNTTGGIQLGKVGAGAVTVTSDGETTQLLVSQESFARRLTLDKKQWNVADQYNAPENKAKVEGAQELDLDGSAGNEIVLVDSGIKKLRVLKKTESVFRPWREVELGSLDYEASRVCDLNGDGKDDLMLIGKRRFAVLYAETTDPTLEEVASFETKLDRVYFQDLVAGDMNADGRPDIAVIDTRSHYIELLNFDPTKGLRHAMQFRVFEEKSFSVDRNRSGTEPREAVIADVTADGRSDLLLLTHDRVLLYVQDSGETKTSESK